MTFLFVWHWSHPLIGTTGRLVLIWSMHTLKHHLELLIKKKAVVILRRAVTTPHRQFNFCLVSSLHEELIERGQYSLVHWNRFSGVIGCSWISCIQWHQFYQFHCTKLCIGHVVAYQNAVGWTLGQWVILAGCGWILHSICFLCRLYERQI